MSDIIGPFIGHTTSCTTTVWICAPKVQKSAPLTLHLTILEALGDLNPHSQYEIQLTSATLGTAIVTVANLKPNTIYYYEVSMDSERRRLVPDLEKSDLFFRTLPSESDSLNRLDFLLISCHNPTKSKDDGEDGFRMWSAIPQIIKENENNIRFAILGGDQIYADDWENRLLQATSLRERVKLYVEIYSEFWGNHHYRKVLCSMPSYLMWDDHDIMDGWGSRDDSFESGESPVFLQKWGRLFVAASLTFRKFQACRNGPPLSSKFKGGYDTCFRVGTAGFILSDLRTNRNAHKPQIWTPEQLAKVKNWVANNKQSIETLFFVTPVVFSHGNPKFETYVVDIWHKVLGAVKIARNVCRGIKWLWRINPKAWLVFPLTWILVPIAYLTEWFCDKFSSSVGDIRDDINDSWGADRNAAETHAVLKYLYSLQNPTAGEKALNIIILSGDIHTGGYSTIYSNTPQDTNSINGRPVIPHIVSSPVSYSPFPWAGEAYFRNITRDVNLGIADENTKFSYSAQISHHFCNRNVAVISLRSFPNGTETECLLKVKWYLEDYLEPQTLIFDLKRGSHKENIKWNEKQKKKKGIATLCAVVLLGVWFVLMPIAVLFYLIWLLALWITPYLAS